MRSATTDPSGPDTIGVREVLAIPESLTALDQVGDPLHARLQQAFGGRVGAALRGSWLGHPVHPIVVTIPIGAWTSAVLLESFLRDHCAARRLIGLGLLAVPFAALTGWADWSTRDATERRAGLVHAAGVNLAALAMVSSYRQRRNGPTARAEATSLVAVLAVGAGGALGGHISFGRTPGNPADR
ncbi:DUF2231 domain-containing protein [Rhodococcus sp. NPDC003322]